MHRLGHFHRAAARVPACSDRRRAEYGAREARRDLSAPRQGGNVRISFLQRLATVATTLGLTAAGLLGAGASPVQAATSDCPSGYFCGWKSADATGSMYKTTSTALSLGS
ncbi:peptidase inhibitor family I36 protein [Streptomyces sp. NPDC056264]|uniref:peptidase inhibitor family I36 protein n=1 Tax=Streptomyces sp. NPDC056264 TaxID=3345767 RepID=UPI003AB03A1E